MTDIELLEWNQKGFLPGPLESKTDFLQRIASTKQTSLKLGEGKIPESHWEYPKQHLLALFDFAPENLPAFYSSQSLAPWQGAAAWIEQGKILSIQLRPSLKKGSFLKIYTQEEILSHEAVHALRSAFPKDPWDEFFAYMTSLKKWRRILGPIIQKPWEVWPLFIFSLAGSFFPLSFLGCALWIGVGFTRLIRCHRILQKASKTLQKNLPKANAKIIRSILVRLTDLEIRNLSSGKFEIPKASDLRSRLLYAAYFTPCL